MLKRNGLKLMLLFLSEEWGLWKSPSELHQWRSLQFVRSNGALHLRHYTILAIRRQFQLRPHQTPPPILIWPSALFLSRPPLHSPAPIAIESDLHFRHFHCRFLLTVNKIWPPLFPFHSKFFASRKILKIRGPKFTELQPTIGV